MLDFAVNVRHAQPPAWLLDRLAARLPDLGRYPAPTTCMRRAGRRRPASDAVDEVVLLAGAAEGFALLPNLRPALAAVIAPSFTEPDAALRRPASPVHHVVLDAAVRLGRSAGARRRRPCRGRQPDQPDRRCCTPARQILALRRPGRVVVVDEAFADAIPGEPESLADDRPARRAGVAQSDQDVGAGRACGWATRSGRPDVLARLTATRPHWPMGTLQLTPSPHALRRTRWPKPKPVPQALADARRDGGGPAVDAGVDVVDGGPRSCCSPSRTPN